eukprot:13038090-Alexandrium_andersonii.AAC.1
MPPTQTSAATSGRSCTSSRRAGTKLVVRSTSTARPGSRGALRASSPTSCRTWACPSARHSP